MTELSFSVNSFFRFSWIVCPHSGLFIFRKTSLKLEKLEKIKQEYVQMKEIFPSSKTHIFMNKD